MYLTLYVDDPLLTEKDLKNLLSTKHQLCCRFDMKDSGEAEICLVLEFSRIRNQRTLKIFKTIYVNNSLDRFGVFGSKPRATSTKSQLEKNYLSNELFL